MPDTDKTNVVQISDFAHLRGRATHIERPAAAVSITRQSEGAVPRPQVPFPGGIDDLPV